MLVEHRADTAPGLPGDDGVADVQRTLFDEGGDDGTASRVQVRLEHVRLRRLVRVGDEVLGDLGVRDEQQRIEQLLDADPGGRGDVEHDRLATPLLRHELLLGELLTHAGRVGVLAVGLRHRDDDRDIGRACVRDRFHRLRHHTVVGGDHEDRDVGDLRAARTHRGERFVARRVDEGDAPITTIDLVRTDRLRDATGFARDDVRVTDGVEQRGLAVVDVTHDRDDGRARFEQRVVVIVVIVAGEQREQLDLLLGAGLDEQHLRAEGLRDQLDHLVGERRGGRDHLARLEQEPHEVGGRSVEPGRELLDRGATRHDDLPFGDRRVRGRESLRRRFELFAVATALLAPALGRAAGTAASGESSGTTARTTAGAATRTTTAATRCTGTRATRATGVAAGTAATTRTTGTTTARAAEAATAAATTRTATGAAGRGEPPRGDAADRAARRRRRNACAGRGRNGLAALRDGWPRRRTASGVRCGDTTGFRRRGRRGRGAAPRPRRPDVRCRAPAGRRPARGPGSGRASEGGRPRARPDASGAGAGELRTTRAALRTTAGRAGLARSGAAAGSGAVAHRRRRGLGLRDRLGFGLRLGLLLLEAPAVGQAPDAVGRGLVDARGVALHADLELGRELHHDVVVDAQLPCELVDPDLLRGQTQSVPVCIREPVSRAGG